MEIPMGLYVETLVHADLDLVWQRTQSPAQHQRWDLRFTRISYLPRAPGTPQRFHYSTRVLPFLGIGGTGVTAGERTRPDRSRVCALRFASDHPLSPITRGSGYWRYVPTGHGVRFLTGYDYRPPPGRPSELADRLVMRPLMGWATAWSFDRLRLWCERDITPERALANALAEIVGRVTLAGVAASTLPVLPALAATALLIALPPLPSTPAARRCRRSPGRRTSTPPPLLARLEFP
ncbi:hypothetical protein [Nocardiopsis ansamitocini]|uniref:Membrane protein YndG n=1 Tax=Nocardiopsis ansamitocini TaxID=1670832 RepID=A0A9W6P746_9ACTN|nr:hypothetical protein [Nocardiopsis ansamitocini]GLU48233.1 hypothetical protein Nans01_25840 [Nocardiopsis ansamitocini]